ncbi:MAG: DUF4405 domain-containing protein [Lysobacterales bacterium]|jgi:hypothetical protein
MRKNKQQLRSLTAFIVTWAFIVLTVTGIILYVVPQGRIAYWVHWSFAGMEKEQWGWVHMMFGGVLIITGMIHLYLNWKPFKKYFADRVKGRFELKQEVFVATGLTIAIFAVSAMNLPPASWIIELNEWTKDRWITSPALEPPFGHAEESSLSGLSRKVGLDIDAVKQALEREGIKFTGSKDTLESIARLNNTTPMSIYRVMRTAALPVSTQDIEFSSTEDIEAKFAGTGLGRKTLDMICSESGVDLALALDRLSGAGISASGEDKVRFIAEENDLRPVELLEIMLAP